MTSTYSQVKALEIFRCQDHQHVITRSGKIISLSTKPGTACTVGRQTEGMVIGKNSIATTNAEVLDLDTLQENGFQTIRAITDLIDSLGGIESVEPLEQCMYELDEGEDPAALYGRIDDDPFESEDWENDDCIY